MVCLARRERCVPGPAGSSSGGGGLLAALFGASLLAAVPAHAASSYYDPFGASDAEDAYGDDQPYGYQGTPGRAYQPGYGQGVQAELLAHLLEPPLGD